MKEELITFETAKLAKEKGFNENCEYSYLWNKKHPEFDDVNETEKQRKSHNEYNIQIDGYSFLSNKYNCKHNVNYKILGYSAPTQSLLQKWLWETFNIFISIIPIKDKDCPIIRFQYRIIDFREDLEEVKYEHQYNSDWEIFDNPYLSNEKGLQEALKLIK